MTHFRAFSILKHARNPRRSRLAPENLDAILRLNLNGPNDLSKFSPKKYTDEWLKNHIRIDDMMHEPKKKNIKLGPEQCSSGNEQQQAKEAPANVMSGTSILF